MDKKFLKKYQLWQNELLTLAIREYGYDHDAIEPLVTGHQFQHYFESGATPREAIEQEQ